MAENLNPESESDTYLTLETATEVFLYKEKNSKFYGYAFPVINENGVKNSLETVKALHKSARHFCYAYGIGTSEKQWRAHDDGEPNNSAGMPIYGQIQSFGLTNVLIVVVRFFGGVKLGVGGLISAYKTTAQEVLKSANIIEKTIDKTYKLSFEYQNLNKVMRIIKEKNLTIVTQNMALDCEITLAIRQTESEYLHEIFSQIFGVTVAQLD
jgi:uncharacterized YigZ family protein